MNTEVREALKAMKERDELDGMTPEEACAAAIMERNASREGSAQRAIWNLWADCYAKIPAAWEEDSADLKENVHRLDVAGHERAANNIKDHFRTATKDKDDTLDEKFAIKAIVNMLQLESGPEKLKLCLSILQTIALAKVFAPDMVEAGIVSRCRELYPYFMDKDEFVKSRLQISITDVLVPLSVECEKVRDEIARILHEAHLRKHNHIFYNGKDDGFLWDEPYELHQTLQDSKFEIQFTAVEGRDLIPKDSKGFSNPAFSVSVNDDKAEWKSSTKKNNLFPEWDMSQEKKDTIEAETGDKVNITVSSEGFLSSEFMGTCKFSPSIVYALQEKAFEHPLPNISLVFTLSGHYVKKGLCQWMDVSGILIVTVHITKLK